MKLKELFEHVSSGTHYKLIGAMTGKLLFRSWRNKETDKFDDYNVATIRSAARLVSTDFVNPIIEIWLSGL